MIYNGCSKVYSKEINHVACVQMRKFIAKNSAGLRVRTNPSLQSEQIGIVKPEGVVSFMDEVGFNHSHY